MHVDAKRAPLLAGRCRGPPRAVGKGIFPVPLQLRSVHRRAAAPDFAPSEGGNGSSPTTSSLEAALDAVRARPSIGLPGSARDSGLTSSSSGAVAASASEQLLSRLKSEAQGRLQLQQQLLELTKQNVESALQADGLGLELETVKRERSTLQERAERQEVTLHMLEVRNARLSTESSALQDSLASLSSNRDLLLQEREQLKAALEQLQADGGKSGRDVEWKAQLDVMELQLRDTQLARDAAVQAQEQLHVRMVVTLQELQEAREQQAAAGRLLDDFKSEQQEVTQSQQQQWELLQQQQQQQQQAASQALLQLQQQVESQALDLQQRQLQEAAAAAVSSASEELLQATQLQLQEREEQCVQLEQQRSAALSQLDGLRSELEQVRRLSKEGAEVELELRRTVSDRDILQGNLASSVRQIMSMMEERDAAVAGLSGAQVQVQEAEQQRGLLQLQLEEAQRSLAASKEQVVLVEGARKEAEQKQLEAQAAMQALSARFKKQEAALVQQLEQQVQRLGVAERMLQLRSQARVAARRGYAPGQAPQVKFVNTNRYWVPQHLLFDFMKALGAREAALQQNEGFIGLQVTALTDGVSFEVASQWQSARSYEVCSQTRQLFGCQLPAGVMQYVPKKGEGYPEDYMPFKDGSETANRANS